MDSEIDALMAGNFFLRTEDQDPALRLDYGNRFDPDCNPTSDKDTRADTSDQRKLCLNRLPSDGKSR